MKEYKYKYFFENERYGGICKEKLILNIEEIESGEYESFISDIENIELKLFARVQFSGMQDARKTEVYEGDIIRVEHEAFQGNCEVIFSNGIFRLKKMPSPLWNYLQNGFVVIGNIYEDKHLEVYNG